MVQQPSLLVNPTEPSEEDEKLRLIPQDDEDQGINLDSVERRLALTCNLLSCSLLSFMSHYVEKASHLLSVQKVHVSVFCDTLSSIF